jgi:hypothetical protein
MTQKRWLSGSAAALAIVLAGAGSSAPAAAATTDTQRHDFVGYVTTLQEETVPCHSTLRYAVTLYLPAAGTPDSTTTQAMGYARNMCRRAAATLTALVVPASLSGHSLSLDAAQDEASTAVRAARAAVRHVDRALGGADPHTEIPALHAAMDRESRAYATSLRLLKHAAAALGVTPQQ